MKFLLVAGVAAASFVCFSHTVLAEKCCEHDHDVKDHVELEKEKGMQDGFDEFLVPDFNLEKDESQAEDGSQQPSDGDAPFPQNPNMTPEEIAECAKYTAEELIDALNKSDPKATNCIPHISNDTMQRIIDILNTELEIPAPESEGKSAKSEESEDGDESSGEHEEL